MTEILVNRIKAQGLRSPDRPLPVVKLEEFFTGNDDYGSIGCNLSPPLGPQYFCKRLNEIRERSNVHDVLVEINEVVEETQEPGHSRRVSIFSRTPLTMR
jgi:hypothetical protein